MFNRALAWQNEQYEQDHKFSYTKLANLLPKWKKELVWLKECHSQVLQQSLKDLDSAFKNFFQQRTNKRIGTWASNRPSIINIRAGHARSVYVVGEFTEPK